MCAGYHSASQFGTSLSSGVLERVEQSVYAMPSNVDALTNLRAAWLALDSHTMGEERLRDLIASGLISHTSVASLHGPGDLLDDAPEMAIASRKQSRRDTRLHRRPLETGKVALVKGPPTTTPARTIGDLLQEGHDPTHVAGIVGEVTPSELVTALVVDRSTHDHGRRCSGAAITAAYGTHLGSEFVPDRARHR